MPGAASEIALNDREPPPDSGLLPVLVGDGRSLLALFSTGLIVSGVFALFLSATHTFLPQDVAFLGMSRETLCALHGCRVVDFMFHDRVSFGGTLIAVGTLYLWLQAFPLRRGETWAWWTLLLSGGVGFASFFSYLLFHYLDTWHATASAALLPLYLFGMVRTRALLHDPGASGWRSLVAAAEPLRWRTADEVGRACLLATGFGMTLAGSVIAILGATVVFVPQDLVYFGFSPAELNAVNPRLIPLIAHDRAGFGGALASCGLCLLLTLWKSRISRALWQSIVFAGFAGFGCAIGVHYPMGYLSFSHLLPAWIGAALFLTGILLVHKAGRGRAGSIGPMEPIAPRTSPQRKNAA